MFCENAFHAESMRRAKEQVLNKARSIANSQELLRTSFYRNRMPKPQPQGSFAMPTNLNGNTSYGIPSTMLGSGGGYRTLAGAEHGRQQLLRRGEQLEQMADAITEGMPDQAGQVPPTDLQMTEDSAEKISIELYLEEIFTTFLEGGFDDSVLSTETLQKLYQNILKHGDQFTPLELTTYVENLGGAVESMRQMVVEYANGERDADNTPTEGQYTRLMRIYEVFRSWLETTDIEDQKVRRRAVKTKVKDLTKFFREEIGAQVFPRRRIQIEAGEAEERIARRLGARMGRAEEAGVVPVEAEAEAEAEAEEEEELDAGQQQFADLFTRDFRELLENIEDPAEVEEIIAEARRLLPEFMERARGEEERQIRRLVNQLLDELLEEEEGRV